ncbi:CsbD family protein [Pontibacter sp. BT310]|uniref:CsbD family protein n=1 Tax=Pontibacter populi TaxID=890055 RepID=A0ABS6X9F1_9BACT|nr:CsbD family protein [Pontibacter populi]MBJ6116873.1 CsbD family protein [Pontibacter sp. BT310]MBR0569295.1 CsbD family protein [Microvirga sp. STS03]MBW3363726.1 CsbD family protein [Pontibacter populi]
MDKNGKILLATLSGIGAGIVAGILLAPDNGQTTRDSVKRSLTKAGEDMERTMKNWMSKLEKSGTTGAGSSLVMHGTWDDVKGQLKQNYAELTEEDLTYAEGKEDELFGRLQIKLGKTKEDIVSMIDNIRNSLK